jgi:hypothetical protein
MLFRRDILQGIAEGSVDALMSTSDTMARRPPPDLLRGTLDLLILRTLQTQPLHGWAIAERIQQISDMFCSSIKVRCIRRSIARSTSAGSKRAVSELGRRATYYHLAAAGRRSVGPVLVPWCEECFTVLRSRAAVPPPSSARPSAAACLAPPFPPA